VHGSSTLPVRAILTRPVRFENLTGLNKNKKNETAMEKI